MKAPDRNIHERFIVSLFIISVLLYFLSADTVYSQRISIDGNTFRVYGKEIFINGVNTPWDNWNDFGGSYDHNFWDTEFQKIRQAGGNASRIWITCNGDVGINISTTGLVTGATTAHWEDLDDMFALAKLHKVYIMATLISFDHTKNTYVKYQRWRNMFADTANVSSYVNSYVIPFINRYKDNPYLWCIDICNEIEWMHENTECGNISWNRLQYFAARVAAAVHENSNVLITLGSAAVKWNSSCAGCEGNFWSDQNLQAQYNSPQAYLDFYSPHFYGWVVRWFGNFAADRSPDSYLINDRPCMVGENPAKGVYKQNTSGVDELVIPISEAYIKTYQQGWKGLMVWTSNGVDGNGSLANCGVGLKAFENWYPELVSPDSLTAVPLYPYFPIVKEDNNWSVVSGGFGSLMEVCCVSTHHYKFSGDTTIQAINYKTVLESTDSLKQYWKTIGFIREDSILKKVWFRNLSDTEGLIYDFDISLGNEVTLYNPVSGDTITYEVTKVDSILLQSEYRKVYTLKSGSCLDQWIEGIGSKHGILNTNICFLVGGFRELLCFSGSDIEYVNPIFQTCYKTNFTPYLTTKQIDTAFINREYCFQITTTEILYYDSVSYSVSNLPNGLKLNEETGMISGIPTDSGTFHLHIFVRNHGYLTDYLDTDIIVDTSDVTEPQQLVISQTDYTEYICAGSSDGFININLSGGTPPYSYSWSNGMDSRNISDLESGNYSVTVKDQNNCEVSESFDIQSVVPYDNQEICLVTFEAKTGKNLLIWEKTPDAGIQSYNIYKESNTAGEYILIGTKDFESPGYLIDQNSNPGARGYKYKITVIDTCGNESNMSAFHQTMLLQSIAVLNEINLSWVKYEGFDVQQYNIWRGPDIKNMSVLISLSGDYTTFTDVSPLPGINIYQLEAVRQYSCNPDTLGINYNSSFSYLPGAPEGINELTSIKSIKIYPNPFNESSTLYFSNPDGSNYNLYVMDLSGKICRIIYGITQSEVVLERGDLKKGFYFIELRGTEIYRGKIIYE